VQKCLNSNLTEQCSFCLGLTVLSLILIFVLQSPLIMRSGNSLLPTQHLSSITPLAIPPSSPLPTSPATTPPISPTSVSPPPQQTTPPTPLPSPFLSTTSPYPLPRHVFSTTPPIPQPRPTVSSTQLNYPSSPPTPKERPSFSASSPPSATEVVEKKTLNLI
jgi:hypothetical protein